MVICKKMPCKAYNLNSTRACDNVLFKTIDVMCRLCEIKKEKILIPKWCPLLPKKPYVLNFQI